MFATLYNLSIGAYGLAARLAAPFSTKARQWVAGRQNWSESLGRWRAAQPGPVAWFHAASLGEFEQGRPVIEAFRAQYPDHKMLLTFFSPSGYEVRKHYAGADYVAYLPADTFQNARQFVALVQPRIVFFIKYEFWANYLHELKRANVPVVLFSAIFRPDQLFFKPYGSFYRKLLQLFSHILVQNQESIELLRQIGVNNVALAGDTRFDRVWQVAAAKKAIPVAEAFKAGQPLLVIGSAWPADMDVLIPVLNTFDQPLKLIVAPHDIHDDDIERWRTQFTRKSVRFSQTSESDVAQADVLFIDNVGMLSSLYQYGEFAYIGGGFGKGIHNILEAATFGMPLFFGPNHARFQEALDLIRDGAAFPIQNTSQFEQAFTVQYANPTYAAQVSRDYVARNIGATAKVMEVVKKLKSERVKE